MKYWKKKKHQKYRKSNNLKGKIFTSRKECAYNFLRKNNTRLEFSQTNVFNRKKESGGYYTHHLAQFQYANISRQFVYEIGQHFSNKNGIGFYTYASLLSNVLSIMDIHRKTPDLPSEAWKKGTLNEYATLFKMAPVGKNINLKNLSDEDARQFSVYNSIRALVDIGLVKVRSTRFIEDGNIYLSCCHHGAVKYNINKTPQEQSYVKKIVKAQFAAINSHSGFVMSRISDFNNIYEYMRKNSEMYDKKFKFSDCDAAIDLWLHCIYRDRNFELSYNSATVLFDRENNVLNLSVRYLAKRWGMSVGKVHQLLNKFQELGFFNYVSMPSMGICIFCPVFSSYLWNIEARIPSYYQIVKNIFPNQIEFLYTEFIRKATVSILASKKEAEKNRVRSIEEIRAIMLQILGQNEVFAPFFLRSKGVHFFKNIISYEKILKVPIPIGKIDCLNCS